jgi:hypothetical protein
MAYIDTHEAIKTLIKEGFEENQAEAITNVINKRDGTLATKADIDLVKKDVEHIKEQMATKADIKDLKSEMIKWFIGTQFATLALIFTVLAYLK